MAAEEKAGLTPAVPLPEDVVYRRFDEWVIEQKQDVAESGENSRSVGTMSNRNAQHVQLPVDELALPAARPPTQSFAAQQRARPLGIVAGQALRGGRITTETAEKSARPVITIGSRHGKLAFVQESQVAKRTKDVEDRLAVDMVQQLGRDERKIKPVEVEAPTISLNPTLSIFNPREKLDSLPNTKPDHILQGLRKLLAELERALNSRTPAAESQLQRSHPEVVVKWVDYTNKFGLGYILSNGSVGCIFRSLPAVPSDPSQGEVPPSCVVVRDAETHLRSRHKVSYPDRKQIVPISGPNIEFYESRGDKGIFRGTVNPQNFKITIGADGEPLKLSRGQDEWDDRKREKIVLWKKFANYMTAFGRDLDQQDAGPERTSKEKLSDSIPTGNVVIFYQRFGDVGVWAFYDGHFQFNFPDHTKVLISADGTWCDFYHLPIDAALELKEKGVLSSKALDDRQHLSFPLQTLLNFVVKPSRVPTKSTIRKRVEIDPSLQGIPEANEFRKKVDFIRQVVKEWVSLGGLGNSEMTPESRLRWKGQRERVNVKSPYKHVWVTVGARSGDERKVAMFDPLKPDEIVPDFE